MTYYILAILNCKLFITFIYLQKVVIMTEPFGVTQEIFQPSFGVRGATSRSR